MIQGKFIKLLVSKAGPVIGNYDGVFELMKLNLVKAGMPKELLAARENVAQGLPIVIEKNIEHYGRVEASQYEPKAVVVCGGARRAALLQRGAVSSFVWVQAGALNINADDAMGAQELLTKLGQELNNKFFHGNNALPNQSYPYVVEAYPFENYCVYCLKGKTFRQHYILDPMSRAVQLMGQPTEVTAKYVDAAVENCGLIANIMYGWKDIDMAAKQFVAQIKTGNYVQLQPDFAPVRISGTGHIVTTLAAAGISPLDFALWSVKAQTYLPTGGKAYPIQNTLKTAKLTSKKRDKLKKSSFAYGDKLPINDPSHARNALARVNQTKGIPESAKAGVVSKIRKAAKKFGVDVSSKPTSGQKKWAHKGMRSATSSLSDLAQGVLG